MNRKLIYTNCERLWLLGQNPGPSQFGITPEAFPRSFSLEACGNLYQPVIALGQNGAGNCKIAARLTLSPSPIVNTGVVMSSPAVLPDAAK